MDCMSGSALFYASINPSHIGSLSISIPFLQWQWFLFFLTFDFFTIFILYGSFSYCLKLDFVLDWNAVHNCCRF
jgi:hypothetical protein